MKAKFRSSKLSVLTLAFMLLIGVMSAFAESWKFGVMSDTQWPNSPDGKNPNVSVNVIRHINQEFIKRGVKFVIQVGDLTDKPGTVVANPAPVENLDIRATFAQELYNAGIGFYPLRGNHEDKPSRSGLTGLPSDFDGSYAREFRRIFPQTQTGMNNATPLDAMINTTIYGPQLNTNPGTFSIGSNFASEPSMEGLTYSFDYNNARFVLIDQFTKPEGTSHSNLNQNDIDWIGARLSDRPANTHAFSFAHKGLITENHADNLFNSSNPVASQTSIDLMDTYMGYLENSDVRYHMGGHDHMHNRAIISSPKPGSTYKIQNIIAASDSYKFYIPPYQSLYDTQSAFRTLEKPIAQELFSVGYYIFTVDGPKVTVDYYAMPNGCNGDCNLTYDIIPYEGNTPTLNGFDEPVPFTRHETFGYSLNGIEKTVDQGGSYALADNTYKAIASGETGYLGTEAAILSGNNGSTGVDYNLRPLSKSVNTGWAPGTADLSSDILTLWGMADSLATKLTPINSPDPQYTDYLYVNPDTERTDTYVLSMTYADPRVKGRHLGNAGFRLATKDEAGNWVNAVATNYGGKGNFIKGPWKAEYDLGSFGIDTETKTVWAVINHNGDFAVSRDIE